MNDKLQMYGDTYTEFNILFVKLNELNMKFSRDTEHRKLFNLFRYLVCSGYINAAEDLWESAIKSNFMVKAL